MVIKLVKIFEGFFILIDEMFYNKAIFIFLINGLINPVLSFHNGTNININNHDKTNKFSKEDLKIVNNNKSKDEKIFLKDIPEFSIEELKNTVKKNKDPFRAGFPNSENSSFENLYIELLGLFKINGEKNAMFRTKDGIKNYLMGEVINENFKIKNINLVTKEVLITDGQDSKLYKFPKR